MGGVGGERFPKGRGVILAVPTIAIIVFRGPPVYGNYHSFWLFRALVGIVTVRHSSHVFQLLLLHLFLSTHCLALVMTVVNITVLSRQ